MGTCGVPSNTVTVHFGHAVDEIKGDIHTPMIGDTCYDLVVLANGGFSSLRRLVFQDETASSSCSSNLHNVVPQPEYAGYVVWRGEIPTSKFPASLLKDIEYLEGVYKNCIYDTIVLKMAKDNGEDLWTFGTFIATPESELDQYWDMERDGKARHHNDSPIETPSSLPDWFLLHMQKYFDHIPGLVSLVEHIVQFGNLKPHPQYEFGNIDKVHNGRIVILGDAAHMASPRTAVGAHTAIQDALALRQAMSPLVQHAGDGSTTQNLDAAIDMALRMYSKAGVAHAQELYARTKEVSRQFVP